MNKPKPIIDRWRKMGIDTKFSTMFGMMLGLIVLIALTAYGALTIVHGELEQVIFEFFVLSEELKQVMVIVLITIALLGLALGGWIAGLSTRSMTQKVNELTAVNQSLQEREQKFRRLLEEQRERLEEKINEQTAALQQTSKELARSNEELEQFAYVASHDLQEPLRMVSTYITLLERRYKGQLGKEADDFIYFAVDGAKRMQQLINDLLTYSSVNRYGETFALCDYEKVLEQVLVNLKVQIKDSGATITHELLPTVMGDESQLEQLFQNLISNAIKFHGEQIPKIHIGSEQHGAHWLFFVRDNGIGMASEKLENIFEIFHRLHGRNEYEGTGIGLAICKKIVERHNGHIWVESTIGEGSTFFFTISA